MLSTHPTRHSWKRSLYLMMLLIRQSRVTQTGIQGSEVSGGPMYPLKTAHSMRASAAIQPHSTILPCNTWARIPLHFFRMDLLYCRLEAGSRRSRRASWKPQHRERPC